VPYVQVLVPREDVESDQSLERIMKRIANGTNTAADMIALAKSLRERLNAVVLTT